jgi:hypothetical protein
MVRGCDTRGLKSSEGRVQLAQAPERPPADWSKAVQCRAEAKAPKNTLLFNDFNRLTPRSDEVAMKSE